MTAVSRLNRRTLLKSSAAGVAALAVPQSLNLNRISAQEAVTVEFWNPGADPLGGPIIQQLVDEYNETAGQEAGIVVNNVPVPGSNDYAKYSTAMTSSSSPDIVMTYGYDPVVPWIANGFVQTMDTQFEELGMKQDDFYPVAWDMISFDDHIWGLPQEFDMVEFFWNTEIHSGDPPTTIDELDAMAADYTQFDDSGNLTQAGLIPWAQGGFSPGGYGSWGTIWGARFYDHANRTWTINRPENTAFLDWYLKYVDLLGGREKADAFISSVPRTYGDIFLYGKTAFAMEGEFIPKEMEKLGLTAQIDIAHPPIVPDLTTHTTMVDAANIFVLPVNSNHPAEGSHFAKYMVSTDSLVAWSVPIGQMMPTKAAANAPELLEALPWMALFNETVESGKLLPPPFSPQANFFAQLLTTAIDEVTYKQKAPADALAEVEAKIAAAVAEFQQQHPDWVGE
ncbi:MAG: extracellular solute-binding protein [Thermomicrobiales bacterium]